MTWFTACENEVVFGSLSIMIQSDTEIYFFVIIFIKVYDKLYLSLENIFYTINCTCDDQPFQTTSSTNFFPAAADEYLSDGFTVLISDLANIFFEISKMLIIVLSHSHVFSIHTTTLMHRVVSDMRTKIN